MSINFNAAVLHLQFFVLLEAFFGIFSHIEPKVRAHEGMEEDRRRPHAKTRRCREWRVIRKMRLIIHDLIMCSVVSTLQFKSVRL